MKKSFLAIFSAAAIAVSGIGGTTAYASVFADINNVPWSGAEKYIDEAYNLGLMAGYVENGQRYCKAKNNVTYCEAVQLMYAIMSGYSGTTVSSSVVSKWTSTMAANNIPSWAYNAVAYALENSILSKNDISIFMSSSSAQNNARREDVAVIFGKALSKVYTLASNPTIPYKDKDKVATTSVPYLELLNRLNIMVGDSNNNFNPKVNINRAEMSVLVTKTYNTLKGSGSNNKPSTGVVQYSGKVTEKTSSGSGYTISVVGNGVTNKFTANASTSVTDGAGKSSLSKISTGDSIVAVCNNGVASSIIIMSQGDSSVESTEKGTVNSISSSKISLKVGSKTKDYDIANEDIEVTIDGSKSSLSSLVSKFKGSSNFTATISLNSDDEVVKIEAKRGTSDDDYDDDAIVSLSRSKVTLNNGDKLDFPDDPDDVSIKIDGKSADDYDELKDAYDDLDDDEQMVVDDYELDKHDELESLKVKIEDKKSSSSSSKSDDSGLIKSISDTKIRLESGDSFNFADEDDIDKLEFDDEDYDEDIEEFVKDINKAIDKDKTVYVELTVKSKEITKAIAYTCDAVEDEEIDKISKSDKEIKVDGDTYKWTSSTTVKIVDGSGKIDSTSKLVDAIEDDEKTITVTIVYNDDDELISINGYVSEIGDTDIKDFNYDEDKVSKCYIKLDNSESSIKYYFDDDEFSEKKMSSIDDDIDDDSSVELELNDEGKIISITIN
ncbi:MAG: S-layer homology domain-containing protein [Clostridiales bacterium]|nr:S-layer homology domain-containing protein [Clostridiales bacterium]